MPVKLLIMLRWALDCDRGVALIATRVHHGAKSMPDGTGILSALRGASLVPVWVGVRSW